MRLGILSSGGDCPGINSTIRGVGKSAITYHGFEVAGIFNGYNGILEKNFKMMTESSFSGLLHTGGTILGTSRDKQMKRLLKNGDQKEIQMVKDNIQAMGLDCLLCIGGNGTQKTAALLAENGINVIGIPKTIDNDIWGTDVSFGFDSAVNIATEAIDRLHSTASSHHRAMVIELMGHHAGWIALHAGMAGGGDVILIPELEYDIQKVCDYLLERVKKKKNYSIIVVAEGITTQHEMKPAEYISQEISERTGLETRSTVLGYVQRGGSPSPYDRILSTQLGGYATELAAKGDFGKMVAIVDGKTSDIPLSEVAGKLKIVTRDNPLLIQGERMGVCFGL